jgi:2-polyprenyl-6-methoxyphenol hydroxylase-like FAD-dependent oxidoreductase
MHHLLKLIASMGTSAAIVVAASAAAVCKTTAPRRVAIIGGSLGGLAAAHALHQTGWLVDVYERATGPLQNKGSGLGFVHVPAWEALIHKTMMRRNRRASRDLGAFYYGDLWKFLYDGLPKDDGIVVKFGKTITELNNDGGKNLNESFDQQKQQKNSNIMVDGVSYDLVILCDGGFSALRKYVLGNMNDVNVDSAQPIYAGYVVWRGSIAESSLSKDVLFDIEEGVYKNGIYDTIVLKMAKDNGENLWMIGSMVATPEDEVSMYWNQQKDGMSRQNQDDEGTVSTPTQSAPAVVPEWFLQHFKTNFNHVPGLVPLMECMVQNGEIKAHPQYEFGAKQVSRGRVILLGDAAHMASPRTAVGAHTAILDALALREAFDTHRENIDDATALYSQGGVDRAQALYARSREVSHQFIPSGGDFSKIVSPRTMLQGISDQKL